MFVCVNAFYLRKSGKTPCVLVLTCAVAVATKWLISHHCLLRSENLFLAIKIHVVFWMDWIFMFGKMFQQGGCQQVYTCFDIGATAFMVEVLSGVF